MLRLHTSQLYEMFRSSSSGTQGNSSMSVRRASSSGFGVPGSLLPPSVPRPAELEKSSQPTQSSVGEVGPSPGLHPGGQQSQDENVPHTGRNSFESQPSPAPSLQAPAPPTSVVPEPSKAQQQQKENVPPPLVKPFPSQPTNSRPPEFQVKDVNSPEPTSTKPPWVKDAPKNLSENAEKQNNHLPTVLPSSPLQNENDETRISALLERV